MNFYGTFSPSYLLFLISAFFFHLLLFCSLFSSSIYKYSFSMVYLQGYCAVHGHIDLARRCRLSRCPNGVGTTSLLSCVLKLLCFSLWETLFSEAIWFLGLRPALAVRLWSNSSIHSTWESPVYKFHYIMSLHSLVTLSLNLKKALYSLFTFLNITFLSVFCVPSPVPPIHMSTHTHMLWYKNYSLL